MLRKHRALIAGLALACVGSANAATLVISEFRTRGPNGGNDEFIEIYNAGGTAQSIGGFKIRGSNASGTISDRVTITAGTTLNPGCHYLMTNGTAGTGYSGSVAGNQTFSTGVTDDGGIALTNASNTIIDAAGLSAGSAFKEGTTLTPLAGTANQSYERKPGGASGNGTDTDNNASDFALTTPSNPQNLSSACVSLTPSISIADATVTEGNGGTATLTFNVTLSGAAPAGGVGFSFATSDGTATTADGDYAANSGTGSIAAGATSTTITVTVIGDAKFEADETLTVTLSGLSNATAGDLVATGTIANDDAQPSLSIADVSTTEGNAGTTTATFTVTQSAVSGLPTTFDLATVEDTATTADNDFAAASASGVTIAPGALTATFDVTINGDTTAEPDETYFVNLTNAVNASIADAQAVGTITNDDVAISPTLSISNATVTEGDSGTASATFTITSTLPAPAGGITVDVASADDTATTADGDYSPIALNATILPGMTTTSVAVQVNGDTKIESNETFFVNLTNAVGATIDDAQGVGTITNDDVAPDLAIGDASVVEGNSGTAMLTFPITLSGPAPAGGIDFAFSTADGTATIADGDYAGATNALSSIPEGATSASVRIAVNGDTTYEPDETLTVTLSNVTQANVTDGTATGTITNDDFLEIHDLQGSGLATTRSGTVVTRGNIVTGKGPQGFTMQAPDVRADADINTSEGIYVFTSTAPTVAVGDMVDVTGTITEFNGLTEITNATIATTSVANPLPTPVEFNETVPSQDPNNPTCVTSGSNYECFEFMRVRIANGLVNTGNQRFGSPATETFAEVFVTANGRRGVREPGILFPIVPTAGNMAAGQWDGNPDMFELDADYFGALPVDSPIYGGTTFSATGVLGYDFGDYELWATEFSVTQAPTYPRPVRDSEGSTDLRIGAYNMLRFCDTVNSAGSGQDPCLNPTPTQAGLDAKVARLSAYVKDVLKLPDVLGVEEVENITVLNALAAKLTTDGGVPYTARLEEGNDIGGIDVGFLIRTDRVSNIVVTQLGKTQTWNDPTGSPTALLHDRPPLMLEANFTGGGGSRPFMVMVVHPKARSCTDQTGGATCVQADVDRNRLKRFEQGKYHAQQIQAYQTAHPNVPFAIVGDFNAYQFTDGWTDVVGLMAGTYDDAANLLDLGANIVAPSLWNAVTSLPLNEQYSFLFTENFGQIQGFNTRDVPTQQVLDHALLSTAAKRMFTGFDYGRADEDAPAEVERQCNIVPTPAPPLCPHPAIGVSDHDGFVFKLATDQIFANGFEAQ
ncbi:Calx-beta domain-containing protein [Tahibacter soli]|uniref:Calx-beta domain-containing protein n=1 Tax=Tahibacter soli TaxID=2983605 RepID=A0A9X4BMS5_9GAMM|nr:Calx-beta domain-containing protein [Tahibacter soli]MDC8015659.1 Calx-beta domain-containing protein [Tahibacter soli]